MAFETTNTLLSMLAGGGDLEGGLERVDLAAGEELFRPGDRIGWLYFPESCVLVLTSTIPGAARRDTVLIGREGCAGLPAFLHARPSRGAAAEIAGTAVRVPTDRIVGRGGTPEAIDRGLKRYVLFCLTAGSISSGCALSHAQAQRLPRWLLEIRDHMGQDDFPVTQAFLAQLLGVRRQTVNEAARRLQADGLIEYARGRIRILEVERLRDRACVCYDLVRQVWERVVRVED